MTIDVKYLKDLARTSPDKAVVHKLFRSSNLQVEILSIDAGQYISPSLTDLSDTLFWVLEGEGVFEAGDEILVLTGDTSLFVEAGESVGIINESEQPLTVLRVIAPAGF